MRAVQITRFGGPEVLEIVDVPEPTPGPGQQLYDVSTAGLNFADTHHRQSAQQTHPVSAAARSTPAMAVAAVP
jgi:NADPH2:quinone reductase